MQEAREQPGRGQPPPSVGGISASGATEPSLARFAGSLALASSLLISRCVRLYVPVLGMNRKLLLKGEASQPVCRGAKSAAGKEVALFFLFFFLPPSGFHLQT